jgi:methanethiol S-methyltransferase
MARLAPTGDIPSREGSDASAAAAHGPAMPSFKPGGLVMKEDVWSHFGTWWAVAAWAILYAALLCFVPFYRKAQRKPAGAFLAFVVAYAVEMFGIPLTLYFVLWAFGANLPEGFLWGHTLVPYVGYAGTYACAALTIIGALLVIEGWRRIHRDYWSADEDRGRLVVEGLYSRIRHPQYLGFLVVSFGVLLEWATLPLVILWPVLAVMYRKLAKREEEEMAARFGQEWEAYKARTGMFLPRLRRFAAARGMASKSAILAAAALALSVPGAAAEGLTWRSYGEAGFGASISGSAFHPQISLSSGVFIGPVELGTYLDVVPTELGTPDLVREGFARWGGSIGASFEVGLPVLPFARIGLGSIGLGRVPEGGSGAMGDFRRSLDCELALGLGLPLGGRWAARLGASWSLAPEAEDYEGRSLSGPSLCLSIRAAWETTLR